MAGLPVLVHCSSTVLLEWNACTNRAFALRCAARMAAVMGAADIIYSAITPATDILHKGIKDLSPADFSGTTLLYSFCVGIPAADQKELGVLVSASPDIEVSLGQ